MTYTPSRKKHLLKFKNISAVLKNTGLVLSLILVAFSFIYIMEFGSFISLGFQRNNVLNEWQSKKSENKTLKDELALQLAQIKLEKLLEELKLVQTKDVSYLREQTLTSPLSLSNIGELSF